MKKCILLVIFMLSVLATTVLCAKEKTETAHPVSRRVYTYE